QLIEGDDVIRAAADEVIALRRSKKPQPGPPRGEHLVLAHGDLLPLASRKPLELNGEQLRLHADLGDTAELSLPMSTVSMLWLAAPDGSVHPDHLPRALAAG